MGTLAFAVLGHKNPDQLGRLVDTLGAARTFVHLDARVGGRAGQRLLDAVPASSLVPRHASVWGGFGIAEAVLECATRALEDPTVTHVAALSGQDLPLVPAGYMESLLVPGRSVVRAKSLPAPFYGRRGGLWRVEDLHWSLRGRRVRVPARRLMPGGLDPFHSSTWSV